MSTMKPSAYKSMIIRKLNPDAPVGNRGGLTRWINEKWRNLTPLLLGDSKFYACGAQSKEQRAAGLPSICRPTVRVDGKTTMLANEFTMTQLQRALELKMQGKRIVWRDL